MKKLTNLAMVAVLLSSFASAFAQQKTTQPTQLMQPTQAKQTPEEKAKATCKQQGLAGMAFDNCVKTELAKVSSSKPAAPATTTTTQPSN